MYLMGNYRKYLVKVDAFKIQKLLNAVYKL